MNQTANQIKSQTGLQNETIEILADELDRIQGLKVLFKSDAGKVMIARLVSNCNRALNQMSSLEHPTLEQLLAHLADYKANIGLLAEFNDITTEAEINRQLEEAVREAGQLANSHTT